LEAVARSFERALITEMVTAIAKSKQTIVAYFTMVRTLGFPA
jgi:hypothetical protein